jgi:hypothetical protein
MKGSIRVILGLLITFGAAGGIDAGNDLLACSVAAAAGLLMMYSGTRAMNEKFSA